MPLLEGLKPRLGVFWPANRWRVSAKLVAVAPLAWLSPGSFSAPGVPPFDMLWPLGCPVPDTSSPQAGLRALAQHLKELLDAGPGPTASRAAEGGDRDGIGLA